MAPLTRVEKKARRRKFLFGLFLILVLSIILLQLLKKSSFFNIKYIDIKGIDHLKEDKLLKETNIKKGKNSFDLLLFKEKSKLLKNPYIDEIKIKRRLPNRISIEIKEKNEVFRIRNIKEVIILDDKGTILDIRSKANENLTIINGLKFKEKISKKDIGKNLYDYIESEEIVDFLKINSQLALLDSFKEVDILEGNKVKIITNEDKQIDFGRLKDIEYKFKLLNEILIYIEEENIQYEKILMDKGNDPVIVREKDFKKDEDLE